MEHPKYQVIAGLAGILTIVGFSHFVYRVHITTETDHLSFLWIFLVLSAQSLLFLYGILNNAYGIYLPAAILITGLCYILYIKLNYVIDNNVESQLIMNNII
jgi:uncharacterized protein with PQ loop repeat